MLTVRKEQIDALEAAAEARLRRMLVRHLVETFPEEASEMGEEAIRRLVNEELQIARAGGLYRHEPRVRFVEQAFRARVERRARKPLSVTGFARKH